MSKEKKLIKLIKMLIQQHRKEAILKNTVADLKGRKIAHRQVATDHLAVFFANKKRIQVLTASI